ncbi:MAG TPA: hypothetical protein VMH61_02905 [Candidatus Acidoferrales bacterium]|nr:hypothetical protein [Candidatus Acidoferrales bacterium]
MKRSSRLTSLLALAALAAVAGCSKSTSTVTPTANLSQTDSDDIAQQVGADVAGQSNAAVGASSARPSFSSPQGASAQAVLGDTTFTAGGITWTLSRTWYDAGGNAQAGYNPVTTVRMIASARGTGAVSGTSFSASFGGYGLLDVNGVAAAQDTLLTQATHADTLQSAFTSLSGVSRQFYCQQSSNWVDVRQLKPVSSNPWPLSGTATFQVDADRLRSSNRGDVEAHLAATVVVTFNGTRYPTVSVDGKYRYQLDLMTGAVAHA